MQFGLNLPKVWLKPINECSGSWRTSRGRMLSLSSYAHKSVACIDTSKLLANYADGCS